MEVPANMRAVTVRRALAAAALAVVALTAGCGSSGGQHVTGTSSCSIKQTDLIEPSDMAGFAESVETPHAQLPVRSMPNHPLWYQVRYVCGSFYGFVTDQAMSGPYRAENNASAQALNYRITKWPYVPLTGSIVSQLPHKVFEVYEAVYQFKDIRSAQGYVSTASGTQVKPDTSVHLSVPKFSVFTTVLGPSASTNERQIRIVGRRGDIDTVLFIQGGEKLSWTDARQYWVKAWTRLEKLPA